MHLIVYTSEYQGPQDNINNVLSDIVSAAKTNNPQLGISGVLFYHNFRFLQVIEGEHESLLQLMSVIEKDPRHENIEILIDQAISKRGFAQWNMDSFNLSETEKINPEELRLIRDAYKSTLIVDSDSLIAFYKAMIETRQLDPKNNN